jgi:D-3-phosphoglycerate dehydrogenase
MKILISDKTAPKCAEILRAAGHEVDEEFGISPDELKSIIPNYNALIVRSATKVTREVVGMAKDLKVIGRAGSGVDNIDCAAAAEKNIVVMNTPGGNTNAVAELTIGYMFALSRDIYNTSKSLKEERWDKKKFMGVEVLNKTLGILGYGKIGRSVALKSKCLGMEVLCYDPYVGRDIIDQFSIRLVANIEQVLSVADYISVHVPKKPETQNMISKEQFQIMKNGVFLINCARGGIIDEKALLWALNEGIVAGAALDVFDVEPPADFTLMKHPKVLCTPHLGAATREAQENVAVKIAEQIADMFAGKGIQNAVTLNSKD